MAKRATSRKTKTAKKVTRTKATKAVDRLTAGSPPEPGKLHPELRPYADDAGAFLLICHPLCQELAMSGYCGGINRTYRFLKRKYAEAERKGDYRRMIHLVQKPYKMQWLENLAPQMTDADYWMALGEAYIQQEFFDQAELRRLFTVDRPGRELLMDNEERAFLQTLPERFEIYRGYGTTLHGWSWTLERDKAIWFAQRFAGVQNDEPPMLATGMVNKTSVVAYFAGRNESEIVVDPKKVKRIQKIELELQKRG